MRFASEWLRAPDDAPAIASLGVVRRWLLASAIGVAAVVHGVLFLSLLAGSRRQRSIASWLVFLTFSGLWLTTALNWRDVSWWGKQQRLKSQLSGFDSVARELRGDWPDADGALASRDAFMAYPVGEPSVLIMLTLPIMPHTETTFGAVERGVDGALRFELAGPEEGDWLEWHPGGGHPRSFVGGLMEPHELERSYALRGGWHLARYRIPKRGDASRSTYP